MASTIKINMTISDDLHVGIKTVIIPTKYQYVRQGERIFVTLMLLFGSTPYLYECGLLEVWRFLHGIHFRPEW